MTPPPQSRRATRHPARVVRVGLAVLVGLLASVWWTAPAAAHAALLGSSPASGTVVATAPSDVTLRFSEPVEPVPGQVRVIGPDGGRADRGKPRTAGGELRIGLRGDAARGTYLVSFRVTSADGHPVSGGFTFSVGEPSISPPSASGTGADDVLVSRMLSGFRYLGYAGLVLLVGAVGALAYAWPGALSRRRPARLGWAGLAAVSVSGLGEIWLQAAYLLGTGVTGVDGGDLLDVLGSRYGYAHLVRLGCLATAVPLLRRLGTAGPSRGPGRWAPVALGLVLLVTWPLSGHPAGSPLPWLSVVLDLAHLAAVSVWLGGLVILVSCLLPAARATGSAAERAAGRPAVRAAEQSAERGAGQPAVAAEPPAAREPVVARAATGDSPGGEATPAGQPASGSPTSGLAVADRAAEQPAVPPDVQPGGRRDTAVAALLPVWSRWAFGAVSVLVVAGVAQAAVEVRGFDQLVTTRYGLLLLGKAAILAVLLGVAGQARRLTRQDGTPPRLRHAVAVELVLAAVVLAVTSVLVQTTPARTEAAVRAAAPPAAGNTTELYSAYYRLRVEVEPGRVGANTLHLTATSPRGGKVTVEEWRVTAALPGRGIAPIDVPLVELTDAHAVGDVVLPAPGRWVFRFTLRTSEIDQATVRAVVPVK